MHRQLLLGEECFARGGIIRRSLQLVGKRLQLLLQFVQIGPYGISENFMGISLHYIFYFRIIAYPARVSQCLRLAPIDKS